MGPNARDRERIVKFMHSRLTGEPMKQVRGPWDRAPVHLAFDRSAVEGPR